MRKLFTVVGVVVGVNDWLHASVFLVKPLRFTEPKLKTLIVLSFKDLLLENVKWIDCIWA